MLRKVYLHGKAGELFGECFELDISTLAEAVRAIGCQVPGFRHYIAQRHFRIVAGKDIKKGRALGEGNISDQLPKGDLHIRPVLVGAKEGGGLLKIVAGVLIAAVAWWAAPTLATVAFGSVTYGNIALMGLGLAAAGMSQLLTKNQDTKTKKDESARASGNLNTMEQGGPVPLIYGRFRVGSTMISSGVTTADIKIEDED